MKCQYCPFPAKGINYKPTPDLTNAPACLTHKTSLFIPFQSQDNGSCSEEDIFLNQLLNTFVGQYNLLKSEITDSRKKISELTPQSSQAFTLNLSITNPHALIRNDKEMMLSSLLESVKKKFKANERQRSRASSFSARGSLKKSQYIETTNQKSGSKEKKANMKTSLMTNISRFTLESEQKIKFPNKTTDFLATKLL